MAATPHSSSETIDFGEYWLTLDSVSKARYREKALACGFDPLKLKKSDYSDDLGLLPAVQYPDIVNYLVIQASWATMKQMKAFKAMDAYNFFVSGWVNTLQIKQVPSGNKVVVYARVNHSQRSRETPLKSWVLCEEDGSVMFAHCTCMAGLSEACSHVGAVLFAIEAGVRMRESTTCTGQRSKWVMPTYVKEIPFKEVREIDFSSAKTKDDQLRENEVMPSATIQEPSPRGRIIPRLSEDEQQAFYRNIAKEYPKAVILSLIKPHNSNFILQSLTNLPKPLNETLCSPDCEGLAYPELITKAQEVISKMAVSEEECRAVEKSTREQSSSKTWFSQRGGRITASKLKAACHTNPDKPSKSLIKMICYPGMHKFSTPATRWGCKMEKKARNGYFSIMSQQHENLTVADSGLHINQRWPYLGASPDSMVECKCCGKGVVEIKCPYKHKDDYLLVASMVDKKFCLSQANAKLTLKTDHEYYYQIQSQLFICDVEYCDFVVWSQNDIHIERILPDAVFWTEATMKASLFFIKGVLPELMVKWFTRPHNATQLATVPTSIGSTEEMDDSEEEERPWCICKTDIEDSMLIGCDNMDCPVQWYHMSCLNITVEPDGEWFCPSCEKG